MITKHTTNNLWIHSTGRRTTTPPRDEALRTGAERYDDGERCDYCERVTERYTHDDGCVGCSLIDARLFHNVIIDGWDKWVSVSGDPLYYVQHFCLAGKAPFMDWFRYKEIKRLVGVFEASPDDFTVSINPCKKGHVGLLTEKGRCVTCAEQRRNSPRQVAKRQGHKWYLPDAPCKKCHQIAERHVSNGRCRGCADTASTGSVIDARQTAESVMMRDCPDLVMSKADAELFGLKVYRTGKECNKGHKAYRYVSTGTCIKCLRSSRQSAAGV